jgi:hypothetical protein
VNTENLINSSLWGVGRGLAVDLLTHPLDVLRIRQQCHPHPETCTAIARSLLQKEGIGAFYQGLPPQLLKTSIKQAWILPMITGLPPYLASYHFGDSSQQALTALAIATVEATVTTPLERARIRSACTGRTQSLKPDWNGLTTYWAKRSINLTTVLVSQQYLRKHYRNPEQPLSLPQLAGIGVQVAFIVSFVSAPLDMANTLKQAKNLSPIHLLSNNSLPKLYRGWLLSALALTVHNIATVIVIDQCDPMRGSR